MLRQDIKNKRSEMKEIGRGGGDRKLHLLSQVLSCQRRSTAALFAIGVKWCQIALITEYAEILAEDE
jgi:hypothetical protein